MERAQTAAKAQTAMIGLSKGDVLACMGVPQAKSVEGNIEVWSYASGNGRTDTFSNSQSTTNAAAAGVGQATRIGNTVYGAAAVAGASETSGWGWSTRRNRGCTVSVVLTDAKVSRITYNGPTGGPLTKGEQCAYAVENCVK